MIVPSLNDEHAFSSPPKKRRYYITERGNGRTVRGFGVRIFPSGARSFVVRYGSQTVTLGPADIFTIDEARSRAREKKRELIEGPPPAAQMASRKTVAELYQEKYLPMQEARARVGEVRETTLDQYRALWEKAILPRFGPKSLSAVTVETIERWKQLETDRPVLWNRALQQLSQALAYGVKVGWAETNPAAEVQPYGERPADRHLSDEEVKRWATALNELERAGKVSPAAAAGLWTLYYTGCRPGELLSARRDWIQSSRKGAALKIPRSKGDRPGRRAGRTIRLPRVVLDKLLRLPASRELLPGVKTLARPFAQVCRKAGVENATPKALRHTWRSVSPESGVSRDHLRQLGGWASHRVPDTVYTHERDAALSLAAEKIANKLEEVTR